MNVRESLIRDRLIAEHERDRARGAVPPLPFGDGLYDDPNPHWHGTNVGLQRHADADQTPCQLCRGLLDELLAAGLAREVRP